MAGDALEVRVGAQKFGPGVDTGLGDDAVLVYRTNAERFEEAWRLRLQYQDKPDISFTNLASFAAMRELCMAEVLSDDHHFEQVNLGFVRLPG